MIYNRKHVICEKRFITIISYHKSRCVVPTWIVDNWYLPRNKSKNNCMYFFYQFSLCRFRTFMNENSSKYYLVAILLSRDNTFQGLCPLVLLLQEAVTIVIVGPHFALIILLTQQPCAQCSCHSLFKHWILPHSSQLGTSWKYGRVLVGSKMFTSYSGHSRPRETRNIG